MSLISTANRRLNRTNLSKLNRAQRPTPKSSNQLGKDSVTLSRAASNTEERNPKKMAIFGSIGVALGVAAATVLCPGAGLGLALVAGTVGGVAGAAIGDGALETAGSKPAREFDPYNTSHILDPDFMFHPENPNNPLNWD